MKNRTDIQTSQLLGEIKAAYVKDAKEYEENKLLLQEIVRVYGKYYFMIRDYEMHYRAGLQELNLRDYH